MELKRDFAFAPHLATQSTSRSRISRIRSARWPGCRARGRARASTSSGGRTTSSRPAGPLSRAQPHRRVACVHARSAARSPTAGFLQADINMFGLTYLQQISRRQPNARAAHRARHLGRGPPTTDPAEAATVVRMASIPHGTTILAQGTAPTAIRAAATSRTSTSCRSSSAPRPAPRSTSRNRSSRADGLPLAARRSSSGSRRPWWTTRTPCSRRRSPGKRSCPRRRLHVSTNPTTPVVGGGTANTAFLAGRRTAPTPCRPGVGDLLDRDRQGHAELPTSSNTRSSSCSTSTA